MIQYKNPKNRLISFSDGIRRYNAEPNGVIEVPDSEGWRAEAFGLIRIGAIAKIPVIIKKKESKIIPQLEKVKGLGKKAIEEILEEYDSLEEIIADIKAKKFKVGGVDKAKQNLILKLVK